MKQATGLAIVSALTFAAPLALARAQEPRDRSGIIVQIDGLKTAKGSVFCDLHDGDGGFPNKPARALARLQVRPDGGKAICAFSTAKAGRYAVAVWHDVDGDAKLDANFLGIPSEPVGSSNNAKGRFGPPKFKDAAFDYRPPSLRQNIRLE